MCSETGLSLLFVKFTGLITDIKDVLCGMHAAFLPLSVIVSKWYSCMLVLILQELCIA